MKHNYTYLNFKDDESRKASLNLFGSIGMDINGHYFADDVKYLGREVDEIEIFINSEGGNVFHGLSIISAIVNCPAKVIVNIEGVALSMAGVIAMAGDKIRMADYSRLMVHSPYFKDKSKLSEKEKSAIDNMQGMLVKIFTNRTGKDETELVAMLEKETWMSPTEALEMKFVDEIYKTGKEVVIDNSLSASEMVAQISNQLRNSNNKNNMKNLALIVAAFATVDINLKPEATENEVLSAVEKLTGEYKQAETKIEALQGDLLNAKKEMVESLVDQAIFNGLLKEDKRDETINAFESDPEKLKTTLSFIAPKAQKILDQGGDQSDQNDQKNWDYDKWQKEDPKGLQAMMISNRAKFDKLFNAYYGEPKNK